MIAAFKALSAFFGFLRDLLGWQQRAEDRQAGRDEVAAKVNGAEISVHQINSVLAKATGVTNENAQRARKEVLDRLVDQQIAVTQ